MPSPRQAYNNQKNCARQRNIPWELTYETWSDWWLAQLGPNWARLRGKRSGQYCMARHGDIGAYSLENIKCILHTANTKEAKPRQSYCRKAPPPKLTKEQVTAIKSMSGTSADIARQIGLSQSWVWRIRNDKARIST
jgi:hypothetical protein